MSGSVDHTLKLWDAHTGEELTKFAGHSGSILSCDFSHDGTRLFSGSNDCCMKLWDVKTGKELCEYWAGRSVHSVGWHPSDKAVVAGDSDGKIHLLTFYGMASPHNSSHS